MKFDYAATTPLVTETLGSDFVGMESSGAEFLPALHKKKIKKPPRGQSDPDYKSSIRGRLLRSRKPRREIAAVDFPSDDDSFNEPRRFNVEDILIEARRKDGRVMLFCLWGDFEPVDASWVSSTDLNAGLRDWWSGERELRYALYREGDFVSYEIAWHIFMIMYINNCPRFLTLNMEIMPVGLSCGWLILADELN